MSDDDKTTASTPSTDVGADTWQGPEEGVGGSTDYGNGNPPPPYVLDERVAMAVTALSYSVLTGLWAVGTLAVWTVWSGGTGGPLSPLPIALAMATYVPMSWALFYTLLHARWGWEAPAPLRRSPRESGNVPASTAVASKKDE